MSITKVGKEGDNPLIFSPSPSAHASLAYSTPPVYAHDVNNMRNIPLSVMVLNLDHTSLSSSSFPVNFFHSRQLLPLPRSDEAILRLKQPHFFSSC
jgi:hypothetical protein